MFTLAGSAAGLSAFFGLPLGTTLFVLGMFFSCFPRNLITKELPHSMSLQYFEALSPSIIASIVSVIVERILITGGVLGMIVLSYFCVDRRLKCIFPDL